MARSARSAEVGGLAGNMARIGRVLSHPIRIRILIALAQGENSPVRIAPSIDEPLGTVAYHFKCLADEWAIELARTVPRRGAIEHIYQLAPSTRALLNILLRKDVREAIGPNVQVAAAA